MRWCSVLARRVRTLARGGVVDVGMAWSQMARRRRRGEATRSTRACHRHGTMARPLSIRPDTIGTARNRRQSEHECPKKHTWSAAHAWSWSWREEDGEKMARMVRHDVDVHPASIHPVDTCVARRRHGVQRRREQDATIDALLARSRYVPSTSAGHRRMRWERLP
ncbi:hypothetical protein SCHPADRAFT_754942 [Schizopora paradoxa]|uniref:Uncharacterized protein n=1 Tax=Schizopora paradoxa TaxID=27342 RepID=A0A0H2QXZ7_9AGAM|nr:hypothetical protein SCHPADRAFT_754942 [Schizopora paradoxa]